jgi:hypothetical protein
MLDAREFFLHSWLWSLINVLEVIASSSVGCFWGAIRI